MVSQMMSYGLLSSIEIAASTPAAATLLPVPTVSATVTPFFVSGVRCWGGWERGRCWGRGWGGGGGVGGRRPSLIIRE